MAKVVNLLSPTQRAKVLRIPDDFSEREIARYYSFSPEDLAVIAEHRRSQNRLGFSVQIAYLRYPGRTWNPEEQIPQNILTYVARQIDEPPEVLADYATRDTTRREHLVELQRRFGFRSFSPRFYRQLAPGSCPSRWGLTKGLCSLRRSLKNYGLSASLRLRFRRWSALRGRHGDAQQQQVFTTLTASLSEPQGQQLDSLLVVPTGERRTPLVWLREPPGPAKAASFLKVIERLHFIRALGLDPTLSRQIHANRLRRLAREGEQYSPQFLARFEAGRRYATLVASLVELAATLTDTALEMHDRILGNLFKLIPPQVHRCPPPQKLACSEERRGMNLDLFS